MTGNDLMREGEHMMTICNACRYCEGFCAVWPAMEYRRKFTEGDLNYLANLCHDCGECYYACQYAPPHDFEVNPPLTFARLRVRSYRKYGWPGRLAQVFHNNGMVTALATSLALNAFFFCAIAELGGGSLTAPTAGGDFYQITPHGVLLAIFGPVSLFALTALGMGLMRFWRESGERLTGFLNPASLLTAVRDTLRLEYLDDQGLGCTYPNENHSQARRQLHHFSFYGFLLCFAATTVGAVYDLLFHWRAPYGYLSLPVVLGALGGVGLVIGPAGLLVLKTRRNRDISDKGQYGIDVPFLVLLLLTGFSGLLLLALRQTAAMGTLLILHLGFVMGLFLVLPYSKFVHGIYRFAALVKYALERERKQRHK